ncbi:MAG: class I SAM-dependent methyltransferase [Anaerolineaceae bacterium]|nr:class I SAM-dependent methyltransferase [Anaerolineaceae bacterium]
MTKNDIERWLEGEGKIFLEDIGIQKGQWILDFGCGAGRYTIPAARAVGKEGRVYALDKDREVLNQLMRKVEAEGLNNVVPIVSQSDEFRAHLGDETIDAVLFFDVLHYMESEERKKIYENAHSILKPGALLLAYPKHCKSDMPYWNLADVEIGGVIEEIESANFYLEGKSFRKLLHDGSYNNGTVLIFRKR